MSWLADLTTAAPMPKGEYRDRAQELRRSLLSAQMDLRQTPSSALLLVAGVDCGGKGQTVQLFSEWMDPRWIRAHAFDAPSTEETERPDFWRYWRRLPPRGQIAVFLSAWYSQVLLERVGGGSDAALETALARIRRFEQMLSDDGMLIFKLWLHLDAEAQAKRFRELEADPLHSWRVSRRDWENWSRYDRFASAAEEIIDATHVDASPWHVVEASDDRRRAIESGQALLAALEAHVGSQGGAPAPADLANHDEAPDLASADDPAHPASNEEAANGRSAFASRVRKSSYRKELANLQGELNALHRRAREAGIALVGVFEGRDASGKGGAIGRTVAALDVRVVDVVRTGPPSDEELRHHYLWRFWRRLPRAGYVTLFDRSWYGRVLAERVEGLAQEYEWRRAYDEINDFEQQLVDHGTVLVKFWLEIDREEQGRRFEERKRVPHKRWKLTDDDRRNRSLWDDYEPAIAEMVERTSTKTAPWTIVSANDKRHARLEVLESFVTALRARLAELGEPRGRQARTG